MIPLVTGAPRVAVAQKVVNYGEVKFNIPIETGFRVQNIGDRPLKILGGRTAKGETSKAVSQCHRALRELARSSRQGIRT